MAEAIQKFVKAESVNAKLGLVLGMAMVSKEDGVAYIDVQNDEIPDEALLVASLDFAEKSRVAKEMHSGDQRGTYLFMFPLTAEIAKAFEITTKRHGLMIGYCPPPDVLAKFIDGTYTGFSIGGVVEDFEMVEA